MRWINFISPKDAQISFNRMKKVYFLVPDDQTPSWGIGMLYHLAMLSTELNLKAFVLHYSPEFKGVDWLKSQTDIRYLSTEKDKFSQDDLLIVPEVSVSHPALKALSCQKIVFVQGGFLIQKGLQSSTSFQELGFSAAWAVMPHIKSILEEFYPIDTHIIPPFVPSYFFEKKLDTKRKRQVLLFPKKGYREAGYMDYEIILPLLTNFINQENEKLRRQQKEEWKIINLEGFTHQEVAKIMAESYFFVNTNCFESLNATVAEAMAAGCISFCYEAYGGQDYLKHEHNSYVFPNNYVYPLLNTLFDCIEHHGDVESKHHEMRKLAQKTVSQYNREQTKQVLQDFYQNFNKNNSHS